MALTATRAVPVSSRPRDAAGTPNPTADPVAGRHPAGLFGANVCLRQPADQLVIDVGGRSDPDPVGEQGVERGCRLQSVGDRTSGQDEADVDVLGGWFEHSELLSPPKAQVALLWRDLDIGPQPMDG